MAAQVALTVLIGILLLMSSWQYAKRQSWHLLVAELLFPWFLWLLFGFGGILAILRVEGIYFYSEYDDHTVLLTYVYALIAGIIYLFGFRLVAKSNDNGAKGKDLSPPVSKVILLLLLILLFDWYVRLQLIRSGLYFTWVMRVGFDTSVRGTNLLYHVQRTIWPITEYLGQ
jgi:hypothetical protein